jgi:hypothetical protein
MPSPVLRVLARCLVTHFVSAGHHTPWHRKSVQRLYISQIAGIPHIQGLPPCMYFPAYWQYLALLPLA